MPLSTANSGIPGSTLADQVDTTNYDTQNSENEKKVLQGTWISGSTPIVSEASPLGVAVNESGNTSMTATEQKEST